MLTSVQGIYREGKVELTEAPKGVPDSTPVIVTFLNGSAADLRERGIDEQKAAELRDRLATFAEDWNSPAMEVYDDYDAAKSKL